MTDNLDEKSNSSNVVEIPDDAKPEDFPDLLEKLSLLLTREMSLKAPW